MRNWEIYAIPCYAEFDSDGNLMEINCTSENPELRGNKTEILTELQNFRY